MPFSSIYLIYRWINCTQCCKWLIYFALVGRGRTPWISIWIPCIHLFTASGCLPSCWNEKLFYFTVPLGKHWVYEILTLSRIPGERPPFLSSVLDDCASKEIEQSLHPVLVLRLNQSLVVLLFWRAQSSLQVLIRPHDTALWKCSFYYD